MPGKIKLQFANRPIGAVVPIYNLPQSGQDLRFTSEVLAGIYLGKIRKWNDPSIRAINHGVTLPNAAIVVVHRADGSGTTFAWTDFLSKTDSAWKSAVGSGATVKWPIGQSAQGNDEISVYRSPAHSTPSATLSSASPFNASSATAQSATPPETSPRPTSSPWPQPPAPPPASTAPPPHSSTPLEKTPIQSQASPGCSCRNRSPIRATKSAVAEFLDWILTSGQKECSALAYNPLPKEVVARELEQLAAFKAK